MRRWGSGGGGSGGGGILRKASPPRRPQLLVFGYSCKLFRDDEKALDIELGRHLIPWMGDDSLKIDRYDARGALGSRELAAAEGCNKSSGWDRLTSEEQRAERLCDEERYRALYCDEDEEEMYREEELKRIHMSNSGRYGQVEFNYDVDESEALKNDAKEKEEIIKAEDEEPFVPSPNLVIPEGMVLPETQKLNTIIEKTASFIASHGTQMEILLKAKQSGNPQFEFLSMECSLYTYYSFIVAAIKEGRYKLQEEIKEDKTEEDDYYLHPSLAPLSVESAPSIPSITYKPSADCAYSMLVNQIKGTNDNNAQPKNETEENNSTPSVDTELAPPGTEPIPINTDRLNVEMSMSTDYANVPPELMQLYPMHGYYNYPMTSQAEISKAPVIYNREAQEENQTGNDQTVSNTNTISNAQQEKTIKTKDSKFTEEYDSGTNSPKVSSAISTGLKLTHYYNSDSENDSDNSTGSSNTRTSQSQLLEMPPSDQQVIIDKMASYVARNGNDFEQIVKMKGDPRFSFLDTSHKYNPYYRHKRSFYERINKPQYSKNNDNSVSEYDKDIEDSLSDKQENMEKKVIAPVSFSIKKMKEPEPILPKPALPYESTSEEETENNSCDNQNSSTVTFTSNEKNFTSVEKLQPNIEKQPEIVIPKIDIIPDSFEEPKVELEPKPFIKQIYQIQPIKEQPLLPTIVDAKVNVNIASSVKRKDNDRKESSNKYKTSENVDYDEYNRRRKRKRLRENRNEVASDVITIDEEFDSKANSECIDLTEECNEDDLYCNKDNIKSNNIQLERKKRAVAFLSSLRAVPAAPIEHHNTLASAMVKTLHTLQKDEKHSPRRKRRRESSSSRKSKKKKSDKRRSSDRYEESDNDRGDAWKQSSREVYKSRAHSRDRHSKKSKRKKSSRDRSPDYYRSRSHKKSKTPSRDSQRSTTLRESSLEKMVDEQLKSVNSLKSAISRKNDQLLTASLKDLVREARKEMTPCQPIKMAVDIFANDQSNTTCASDNEWEKDSNDDKKYKSKSSSSSTSSSEDSAET